MNILLPLVAGVSTCVITIVSSFCRGRNVPGILSLILTFMLTVCLASTISYVATITMFCLAPMISDNAPMNLFYSPFVTQAIKESLSGSLGNTPYKDGNCTIIEKNYATSTATRVIQ